MAQSAVLAGYRRVIRTIHTVFRGDNEAIRNAVAQAGAMTRANMAVSNPEEVEECVAQLAEADEFLRQHVVQAALTDEGSYAMTVEDRHVGRDGQPLGPVWAKPTDDGDIALEVIVQSGAKAPGIVGEHGERLKVKVRSEARDGKANDEVAQVLAQAVGVNDADVSIDRGRKSREKLVTVGGGKSLAAVLDAVGWEGPDLAPSQGAGLQLQAAHDAAEGGLKDPGSCGCSGGHDHDHDHDHDHSHDRA